MKKPEQRLEQAPLHGFEQHRVDSTAPHSLSSQMQWDFGAPDIQAATPPMGLSSICGEA